MVVVVAISVEKVVVSVMVFVTVDASEGFRGVDFLSSAAIVVGEAGEVGEVVVMDNEELALGVDGAVEVVVESLVFVTDFVVGDGVEIEVGVSLLFVRSADL